MPKTETGKTEKQQQEDFLHSATFFDHDGREMIITEELIDKACDDLARSTSDLEAKLAQFGRELPDHD